MRKAVLISVKRSKNRAANSRAAVTAPDTLNKQKT